MHKPRQQTLNYLVSDSWVDRMLVAAWDAAPLPIASHMHKPLALLAPSRRNSSKLATVICV